MAATEWNGRVGEAGVAQPIFGGAVPNGYLIENTGGGDLFVSDGSESASDNGTSFRIGPGERFVTPPGYSPPGPVSLFSRCEGNSYVARWW